VTFNGLEQALREPDTNVLLFGKAEARPGRRMGVALARGSERADAQARADRSAASVTVQIED
jgi:phosphoribosylglycinamide formyltransferase 2